MAFPAPLQHEKSVAGPQPGNSQTVSYTFLHPVERVYPPCMGNQGKPFRRQLGAIYGAIEQGAAHPPFQRANGDGNTGLRLPQSQRRSRKLL